MLALPVLPGDGRTAPCCSGPAPTSSPSSSALDLLALLELSSATGKAGEVTSLPVPLGGADNAALRWVLLVGVGEQRPDDFRRAGAALARATRDRTARGHLDPGRWPADGGLEAFVVGAMLGSFAFHWRSGPPEHVPVGRIVLAGLPDADDARAGARARPSPSAAPAGAPGCWRRCRPTSRTPPGWPSRPRELAGECGARRHASGTSSSSPTEGFGGIARRRPGLGHARRG